MQHLSHYASPLGPMLLAADEIGLVGIWFAGQAHFASTLSADALDAETSLLQDTKQWLDSYFSGKELDFPLPLHLIGTPFQLDVWKTLLSIPYGDTVTYGALAKQISELRGTGSMSARAVGGAVGKNPISIVVPCHRVVGKNRSMTGYAGGLERKAALLQLEQARYK